VLFVGSISNTDVESKGIPYILPLGANTPPTHLELPVKLPKVVVVLFVGSISKY
jgi:hypothetical protein